MTSADHFGLEVRLVSEPVVVAGWYLAYRYGVKPLVMYASRGMTVWREGMRQIPITRYAGPIPELR
ncbi:hypothetical protein N5C16_05970 [Stenotrophomonas sp. GD03908]|uniref:Uncharacterized protein n=1 Tax=Stenotrophomonas maltophilia TaxID=40324 RepID=A0AAJ2TKT3_STEMA|nr:MULTISPECIES: hypothetical protein [Stenotrophomonas]MBH1480874.1 hypothetical protein [Stenotrophomonas maltophilia]MDH0978798.1 hypothetical protein [Stenotrophomonas sp. GD03908]MDQ7294210.1 hypothetical protein [Stenotrophomonas sp. Sm0041]MDZ5764913.1 hypothetical protein [Stenotrophomonas maltophilia]